MSYAPEKVVDPSNWEEYRLSGFRKDDGIELQYSSLEDHPHRFFMTPWNLVKLFEIEKVAPRNEVVRQGKYECAAASLAQLLGHTLFQIKRIMGSHGWRNDDGGASNVVMRETARSFGHDLIYVPGNVLDQFGSDLPPASVSVKSLNYNRASHGVTWIDGEIIDPNFGDAKRKFWGANWKPWAMGAYNALVLAREPLPEEKHRELNKLIKERELIKFRDEVLKLV